MGVISYISGVLTRAAHSVLRRRPVPTPRPTPLPTVPPTGVPTLPPTSSPSPAPAVQPTGVPTLSPTSSPSAAPTLPPTRIPTLSPTASPSAAPTVPPTLNPTATPSGVPTLSPTGIPSASPTTAPSLPPTGAPSVTLVVSSSSSSSLLPVVIVLALLLCIALAGLLIVCIVMRKRRPQAVQFNPELGVGRGMQLHDYHEGRGARPMSMMYDNPLHQQNRGGSTAWGAGYEVRPGEDYESVSTVLQHVAGEGSSKAWDPDDYDLEARPRFPTSGQNSAAGSALFTVMEESERNGTRGSRRGAYDTPSNLLLTASPGVG